MEGINGHTVTVAYEISRVTANSGIWQWRVMSSDGASSTVIACMAAKGNQWPQNPLTSLL